MILWCQWTTINLVCPVLPRKRWMGFSHVIPVNLFWFFPLGRFFAEGIYCVSDLRLFVSCLMWPWEMFPGIKTRSTDHITTSSRAGRRLLIKSILAWCQLGEEKAAKKHTANVLLEKRKKIGHHKCSTERRDIRSLCLQPKKTGLDR